jgi:SAM-dependent methyltransferase
MRKIAQQDERGFNQVFAPVGTTPLRMQRRNDWFVAQIGDSRAKRVLELGCGTGETAGYIADRVDAEVVGIDISDMFLEQARRNHQAANLRYVRFDLMDNRPPPFGSFDLVYGNGILHHLVKRLPAVLASLRALANPGAQAAFIEPNFLNPFCAFAFGTPIGRRWARLEPDEMAFTRRQICDAFGAAGWRDVRVATRDFLVPGLPVSLARPITALEPLLEATPLTWWLAQSHFILARDIRAGDGGDRA